MPMYEFSCSTCGQTFEKNLSFQADQAGVRCPSGHSRVRRIYSAPPVVFKGSGFYITDHQKSSGGETSKP
jgi:putative FmdB family regulatory protein